MARGDREKACLDRVRGWFFKSKPDCLTKKTFEQVDAQELSDYTAYMDGDVFPHLYGVTPNDLSRLSVLLGTAKENPKPSEFPDFISASGFIEHFEITASITNRKGSTHRREHAGFEQRVRQSEELIREQLDRNEGMDTVLSKTDSYWYHDRSYANLVSSFQTVWSDHCRHLDKYGKDNGLRAFMVEFQEGGLGMCENVYETCKGLSFGDLREQQRFGNYRLSRDKALLNWIHENSNGVDYVIFVGIEAVEIIKITSIPQLLTLLPWDFVIECGPTIEVSSIKATTIPAFNASEKDKR